VNILPVESQQRFGEPPRPDGGWGGAGVVLTHGSRLPLGFLTRHGGSSPPPGKPPAPTLLQRVTARGDAVAEDSRVAVGGS